MPSWLRTVFGLVLLVIAAAVMWYWSIRLGILIGFFGLVVIIFGEKSKSEKGGYNF